MELLQLKYFCHAAETQNFSKTAKEFGVPASNISQTVHRLEKELKTTLFDRSANRIYLNEKGHLFYNKIKEALINIDEAERIALDKGDMKGEIHLRVNTNRRLVTDAIGKFRKLYPDVTFVLSFDSDTENFDLLIGDETGFKNMNKTTLVQEKILLAVEENQAQQVNKDTLKNMKFITMSKNTSIYKITGKICNANGFEPNIVIQSDDPFYLREYVSLGLGAAFFPEKSWKGQFRDNVKFVNVTDFQRITYVFWHKNRYMSEPASLFLKMLLDAGKKY